MSKRITNKIIIDKIKQIQEKLPNGELEKIHKNVKEIKEKLELI